MTAAEIVRLFNRHWLATNGMKPKKLTKRKLRKLDPADVISTPKAPKKKAKR